MWSPSWRHIFLFISMFCLIWEFGGRKKILVRIIIPISVYVGKTIFQTSFPSSRRGVLMYGKGFSIWPGSFVHARCSSMLQTILYLKYSAAIDTVFALGVLLSSRRAVLRLLGSKQRRQEAICSCKIFCYL